MITSSGEPQFDRTDRLRSEISRLEGKAARLAIGVERLEADVERLEDENRRLRASLAIARRDADPDGPIDPVELPTITKAQAAVLQTILDLRAATGCTPSMREIAEIHRFISPQGARKHLLSLESKGWLAKATKRGSARALVPTVSAIPPDRVVPGRPRRAVA